jgi:hypothetical protein
VEARSDQAFGKATIVCHHPAICFCSQVSFVSLERINIFFGLLFLGSISNNSPHLTDWHVKLEIGNLFCSGNKIAHMVMPGSRTPDTQDLVAVPPRLTIVRTWRTLFSGLIIGEVLGTMKPPFTQNKKIVANCGGVTQFSTTNT